MVQKLRFFIIGLLFAVISLVIFIIIGLQGWTGDFDLCNNSMCFCEMMVPDALIAEPVNTWSNLAYIFMGLLILWKVDESANADRSTIENPMAYPSFFSVFYGFLVINIGLGSWLFHANMRVWAGIWDVGSMNMYMSFLLLYIFGRYLRKSTTWFVIWYVILNILLFLQLIYDIPKGWGTIIFTILVAICGLTEIFSVMWVKKHGHLGGLWKDWRWFVWGFGLFNFGFIIWNLTNTGRPLCDPTTFWQGHMFWHIFTAIATYFFYVYFKTEKKVLIS